MKAAVVASHAELDELARSFVPLEVDLSNERDGRRIIRVHRFTRVEIVPLVGVRVIGASEIEWTVLGVTVPAHVDDLAVMIHLEVTGGELHFRFEIERADLRHVPGVIEGLLATRINEALRAEAAVPTFRFAALLERRAPVPAWLGPARDFVLSSALAELSLEGNAVTLAAHVDVLGRPALSSS
ncbi:MAG: hypothetical protein KC657_22455 [Myxococcales bacterium]|nr:hypothetical protein [Myxococcales bacterium]